MRRTLADSPQRTTTNAAFVLLVLLLAATCASAQVPTPSPQVPPGAQTSATTADEDFELNIGERRITESDFHASTDVEARTAGAGGLTLRVGVMVRAAEIDVLLRNVQGRVRFRASLEPVLRLFDVRRAAQPPAPVP